MWQSLSPLGLSPNRQSGSLSDAMVMVRTTQESAGYLVCLCFVRHGVRWAVAFLIQQKLGNLGVPTGWDVACGEVGHLVSCDHVCVGVAQFFLCSSQAKNHVLIRPWA